MSDTIFFSENYFNEFQFPDHTISESSAVSGVEIWKVANGRRAATDKWVGASNTIEYLNIDAGSGNTLSPTTIAIDRGHNLGGKTVKLEYDSASDFSSATEEWSVTFPAASSAGTDIDAANGCLTEEGAWLYRFGTHPARYWRLHIPAVSSYAAEIVGLYLGTSFNPSGPADQPFGAESGAMGYEESLTQAGWVGTTPAWDKLEGRVQLRLDSADEAAARQHIVTPFCRAGRLMWIVPDQEAAEQSFLAEHPPGRFFYGHEGGWGHRTLQFNYREKEPKLR